MKAELDCMYGRCIIGEQAGSCSHLCWTSTANALFVKLLYFRAVLLLGHLPLTSSLQRDKIDFFMCRYSVPRLSQRLLNSTVIFMISDIIATLLNMTALFFCFLLPLCYHWWLHAAIILMFPLKQTTSQFNQISLSVIKPDPCSDPCLKAMLVNLPRGRVFLL